MKNTLTTLLIFISSLYFYGQHVTYYVDQQNGSNGNNGTTPSNAFRHFDTALSAVHAGDTISIMGTYHNPSYDASYNYSVPDDGHLWHKENTLQMSGVHGNSGGYITIKAYDSSTKLLGDGANIVRMTNCSYIRFEDFEIEGEVDRIPIATANALQFVYIIANSSLQGTATDPAPADIKYRNLDETNDNDGVVEESDEYTDISNLPVKRPSYIDTRGFYATNVDHLIIKNNTIHHTPGGGLRVSDSKNVEILENEIYRCSARSYSGTHALVVTKTKPINSNNNSIIIERNLVHHNYNEQFSWSPSKTIITPRIDEGKGISLQRNNKNNWVNGQGRIRVANNLCYWNGFSGVHSNDGYRIDFINNTCFMNSYTNTVTYDGQLQQGQNIGISTQRGNDIRMINNISVIDGSWGGFALSAANSSNLTVSNNVIYSAIGSLSQDPDISGSSIITQNPMFVQAPSAYHDENYNFDFNLQTGSPAIGQAYQASFVPTDDYFGNQRDASPDIGAIEFIINGISDNENAELSIYPNPINNILYIRNLAKDTSFTLYDMAGKRIKNSSTSNSTIDVSSLASGIYMLNIGQNTYKIIKK